jgi:hypothetical protein
MPRVAWPDADDSENATEDSSVAEMALQIRRDLLERRILGTSEEPAVHKEDGIEAASTEAKGQIKTSESTNAGTAWVPRTDDARSAIEGTDKTLMEAFVKAEARRKELTSFMEDLRKRTFEDPTGLGAADTASRETGSSGHGSKNKELLVSLPADFEDLVDLNAQLSGQRREKAAQRKRAAAAASNAKASDKQASASAKASARSRSMPQLGRGISTEAGKPAVKDVQDEGQEAATEAGERLRVPAFLEKYFREDKALEQLPHKRLEKEEEEAERVRLPDEESDLQQCLRQIGRLDGLLLKREAAGSARLQASKLDLDAAKEKLSREADNINEQKIQVLQRLKERGLVSAASSAARSGRSSRSECSTVEPSGTPTSSRSLATTDGGELPSSRSRATNFVRQVEEAPAISDWSGWTSTAAVSSDAAVNAVSHQLVAARGVEPEHGAPPTNVTDADTSTFELTSGSFLQTPQKSRGGGSDRHKASSGLPTVDEDDTPAPGEGVDDAIPEENVEALADEPYVEDLEAIDALKRIDEQLQKLVPEQEWEAKSICSLPSRQSASAAGDSVSQTARSVWSRASGGVSVPGDPVLCEQFERRESELALVSIDNRLNEILCSEASPQEPPNSKQLKQLLLQAAQDTAVPDAESRVLALTGTAPLRLEEDAEAPPAPEAALALEGGGAGSDSNALVQVPDPGNDQLNTGLLSKARQILNRLENEDGDWVDAFGEAQSSLNLLEEDLRHLESGRSPSRPGSSAAIADGNPEIEAAAEAPDSVPSLAPFAGRLEELQSEVASVLERRGPDEDLISRIRRQLQEESENEKVLQESAVLPTLGAAGTAMSDLGLEQEDFELDSDVNNGEFEAWNNIREGPNMELLKALDVELPAQDGVWSDAELERMCGSINNHFGDIPVPVLRETDLDDPREAEPLDTEDG